MVASTKRIQSVNSELSKTERVYQILRRRIRELELPPGSRLQKNDIADELGVSRAPVNEAIAKLSEEGLVDVFPQNGSFVAPIRPEDIRESMLIRTGLEVEAVRRITAMHSCATFRRTHRGHDELISVLIVVSATYSHERNRIS